MQSDDYLQKKFPELKLRPPLFYNWDIAIRFELGPDGESNHDYENTTYLEQAYKRAVTLFKSIHSQEDNIYLVVDVDDFADNKAFTRKLSIFAKYVKDKSILRKLQQKQFLMFSLRIMRMRYIKHIKVFRSVKLIGLF